MPQRAIGILAGIAGLAFIVGLILIGRDLRRSTERGPRWKRRLVAAGLFLLASMGVSAAGEEAPATRPAGGAAATTGAAPVKDLAGTPQWKTVVEAWREAGPLARSGQSTEAQRKSADAKLKDAEATIAQYLKSGLLSGAEAGLLASEAQRMRQAMYRNPPIDSTVFAALCYDMAPFVPATDSLDRLSQRLPLLEQLAAAGKPKPAVLARVLETFEADLAILSDQKELAKLTDAQRQEAQKVRAATQARLDKIKAATSAPAGELNGRAEWKSITDAWYEIPPLTDSGQSTEAQRKSADEKLTAAEAAIEQLSGAGLLSKAEAGLLASEAQRLRQAMYRNPPTDSRVSCYTMPTISPARDSLGRLALRLPLLEELAKTGKVKPEVLLKILPSVQEDLKTLSDEQQLKALDEKGRSDAQELRKRAQAAVNRLRDLLIEITCYLQAGVFFPDSAEQAAKRAALLGQLVRSGKIRPEVLARIPAAQEDRT